MADYDPQHGDGSDAVQTINSGRIRNKCDEASSICVYGEHAEVDNRVLRICEQSLMFLLSIVMSIKIYLIKKEHGKNETYLMKNINEGKI